MAKYVCDTAQVISAGDKLCSTAQELKTAVSSYSSEMESDLSGWNGKAKSSFQSQCDSQVAATQTTCEQAEELGEFIKSAAQAIEDLESQLASQSI